jgi:two-component system, NarL family, nitrate/nitrite response regulator NarL
MNKIRVLICDDNILYRSGIINLLKDEPGIIIVGEAGDGSDLIKKYELLKPALVITDISMSGLSGADAVKELKLKHPDIKVLFLSMHQGELYIYYAVKVGGFGLLTKNFSKRKLLYAIHEVYNGRTFFGSLYDEEKIQEIIKRFDNQPGRSKINSDTEISRIEGIILEYISDGLSNAEIAEKIGSAISAVDAHQENIMHKFELKNTFALIRFAVLYNESKLK